MRDLIIKIAECLKGVEYQDLTSQERAIADLLIQHGYITKDEKGNLKINK